MKPEIDHEAAQKWAEAFDAHIQPGVNLSSCYLDAMAQLDKATELLRAALGRSECYDEDHECGETDTTRAIRAFLDERK